jgi:hypothetical protein
VKKQRNNMKNNNNLKPFEKGISGNPKGRPPIKPIIETLESNLNQTDVDLIVKKLVKMAKNGNLKAIEYLFNRLYGKTVCDFDTPQQQKEIEIKFVKYNNAPP